MIPLTIAASTVDAVDQVVDVDLRQDLVEVDSIDQCADVDPSEDGLHVDAVDDFIDVDGVDDGRRDLVHDRLEDRGGVVPQRVEQRGPTRSSQRRGSRFDRHESLALRSAGGSSGGAASLRGGLCFRCIRLERGGEALDEQLRVGDRVGVDHDADVEAVAVAEGADVREAAQPRAEGEALLDQRTTHVALSTEARHRRRDEVDGVGLCVERGREHSSGEAADD
jgi:hypothetical protein